jgi:hypothetical protein
MAPQPRQCLPIMYGTKQGAEEPAIYVVGSVIDLACSNEDATGVTS